MRKTIFRIGLAIVLIVSFSFFGLILWLRSGSFNNWAVARLNGQLEKYNLCFKAERGRISPYDLQADAEGARLALCADDKILVAAHKIHVKVRVKQLSDLLEGKMDVQEVALDEPHIYVEFDDKGISN